MVICLSETINCQISKKDIKDIYRVRGKKPDHKNAPIIVETHSALLKSDFLKMAKAFNIKNKTKLCAKHLGLKSREDTPVFLSEHLTAKGSRLHYLARDLARSKEYKFCWTSYGKVYVRKNEQAPIILIRSEQQAHQLLLENWLAIRKCFVNNYLQHPTWVLAIAICINRLIANCNIDIDTSILLKIDYTTHSHSLPYSLIAHYTLLFKINTHLILQLHFTQYTLKKPIFYPFGSVDFTYLKYLNNLMSIHIVQYTTNKIIYYISCKNTYLYHITLTKHVLDLSTSIHPGNFNE